MLTLVKTLERNSAGGMIGLAARRSHRHVGGEPGEAEHDRRGDHRRTHLPFRDGAEAVGQCAEGGHRQRRARPVDRPRLAVVAAFRHEAAR